MGKDAADTQLSDVAPSTELLSYYQRRIDEFETERGELLERIDTCGVSRSDLHRLEWENKKRADEVRQLQKALSDAHTFLFDKHQQLLQLQAENDDLAAQEKEDRKRIQHLLALNQPIEQEITYQRAARPQAVTVFPRAVAEGKAGNKAGGSAGSSGSGEHQERVMRTVYLPAANADSLMLKVESLQAQLNEQKQFANERIAALLEDRRIREADEEAHRELAAQKLEELTARLKKTEQTLQATTKDYILARREKQEAEGRAVTAREELRLEKERGAGELAEFKQQALEQLSTTQQSSTERMEEYMGNFRTQIRRREEDIANLESVHSAVKAQHERRIGELEGKVARLQEQNKQLEYRRALDVEGWVSDVTILRKQLAAVDRKLHQMRLKDRLQDDERLDALLDDLARRAPNVMRVQDENSSESSNHSVKSATSELAADLKRVKGAIGGLETKLQRTKRSIQR
ncbi:hypothetical protein WJX72_004785 [[Myrmecia] bisecta]|uniref:Coiled-coil domain-containing protein 77 n=1 Tax=[Myrmecia] bisecta TaxID=41462 RepID=A0AAW1PXS9_9CHLO